VGSVFKWKIDLGDEEGVSLTLDQRVHTMRQEVERLKNNQNLLIAFVRMSFWRRLRWLVTGK